MTDGAMDRIIQIVCEIGKVSTLSPDQDFYDAGVSSISALALLLELESAYGISIPDDEFIKARTARALHAIVHAGQGE